MRHHFERFKLRRTLRGGEYPVGQRNTFAFRSLRYGENVKFYRTRGDRGDRGSCVSFTTSTTNVSNNSHLGKLSNQRQLTNGMGTTSKIVYGPVTRRCSEEIL